MVRHRIVCDPKSEPDGSCRLGNAEHDGVSDRLYALSRDLGQLRIHCTAEVADELDRGLVTVGLRQGGEAGDVRKQEGRRRISHELYLSVEARAVGESRPALLGSRAVSRRRLSPRSGISGTLRLSAVQWVATGVAVLHPTATRPH